MHEESDLVEPDPASLPDKPPVPDVEEDHDVPGEEEVPEEEMMSEEGAEGRDDVDTGEHDEVDGEAYRDMVREANDKPAEEENSGADTADAG